MGGGGGQTAAEVAQAMMLNWSADQTKQVWDRWGEPEMERWANTRREQDGIRQGFVNSIKRGGQAVTAPAQVKATVPTWNPATDNPYSPTKATVKPTTLAAPAVTKPAVGDASAGVEASTPKPAASGSTSGSQGVVSPSPPPGANLAAQASQAKAAWSNAAAGAGIKAGQATPDPRQAAVLARRQTAHSGAAAGVNPLVARNTNGTADPRMAAMNLGKQAGAAKSMFDSYAKPDLSQSASPAPDPRMASGSASGSQGVVSPSPPPGTNLAAQAAQAKTAWSNAAAGAGIQAGQATPDPRQAADPRYQQPQAQAQQSNAAQQNNAAFQAIPARQTSTTQPAATGQIAEDAAAASEPSAASVTAAAAWPTNGFNFLLPGSPGGLDIRTPRELTRYVYDSEWWAKNGEALMAAARRSPEFGAWVREGDPEIAEKFGFYNDEPSAPIDFDPEQMGFGQVVEAPELIQRAIDYGSIPEIGAGYSAGDIPGGIKASDYGTGSFSDLSQYATQMKAAPDAATVGRAFEDKMTTANLLGQDSRLRSAAGAANASMATRGLGSSSAKGTQQQALANMAAVERAKMQADTFAQRQALEAGLRGEANQTLGQQAGLQQALRQAENARIMEQGQFAKGIADTSQANYWTRQQFENSLEGQKLQDWYNRTGLRQSEDAMANQNAVNTANWHRDNLNARKSDQAQALNFLTQDMAIQLDPYQSVNAGLGVAQGYGSLNQSIMERQAQSGSFMNTLLGMLGSAAGRGMG